MCENTWIWATGVFWNDLVTEIFFVQKGLDSMLDIRTTCSCIDTKENQMLLLASRAPFVSLCQRRVTRAWWIFPQPLILFVFSAPLSHGGDILIAPTHFTSCTKSLWNSHYIGDLLPSACGWCMHATHACHTSLPIHMIRTLCVCSCSLTLVVVLFLFK